MYRNAFIVIPLYTNFVLCLVIGMEEFLTYFENGISNSNGSASLVEFVDALIISAHFPSQSYAKMNTIDTFKEIITGLC